MYNLTDYDYEWYINTDKEITINTQGIDVYLTEEDLLVLLASLATVSRKDRMID